ncbi:UNVERIFIED_CONTAM: protein ADP-ribosyltransferase PARP3 [Sesamum radiatum]|uniref:Poly [ADP-ribose] polymerase n=1 Tax=Sesamum radiatum TaxID=300843 RepID=A0AAW2UMN6_SESRA
MRSRSYRTKSSCGAASKGVLRLTAVIIIRHAKLKSDAASAEGVLAGSMFSACRWIHGKIMSRGRCQLLGCVVLSIADFVFGKAIVCSDAAAEAARYGFTAVDRPEGFLVLAVASLGEQVTELTSPPENSTSLEEKKLGVVGLGRKKTDESEHFNWKDDIKVPCGKLIPSEHEESQLEYNEYAVYDPQQVSICFLVAVKFEEKDVEYDTAE